MFHLLAGQLQASNREAAKLIDSVNLASNGLSSRFPGSSVRCYNAVMAIAIDQICPNHLKDNIHTIHLLDTIEFVRYWHWWSIGHEALSVLEHNALYDAHSIISETRFLIFQLQYTSEMIEAS